jgi:hypothetical protein
MTIQDSTTVASASQIIRFISLKIGPMKATSSRNERWTLGICESSVGVPSSP